MGDGQLGVGRGQVRVGSGLDLIWLRL